MLLRDVISVWVYRRAWSAWNLKVMLAGALAGVGARPGCWPPSIRTDAQVRLAVGVPSLPRLRALPVAGGAADLPADPRATGGVIWGALSAFTQRSFAHAGSAPPFQIHVLPQRLDKLTFGGHLDDLLRQRREPDEGGALSGAGRVFARETR